MRSQKNLPEQLKLADFADKSLLILDDDDPLRGRLARAMEKKGFQVKEAKTVLIFSSIDLKIQIFCLILFSTCSNFELHFSINSFFIYSVFIFIRAVSIK